MCIRIIGGEALVKTQIAEPTPTVSESVAGGWGLRMFIFTFPGGTGSEGTGIAY